MSAVPGPTAHGGDGARVAKALGLDPDRLLDLSASLNPLAPDPVPVVARHLDALGRYPDDTAATEALAAAMGIPAGRLILTNGGAEAIALVGAELGGQVDEPDFSLYPRSGGPRWRSNPHNPTGRLAGAAEHAGVWDEAFFPLATGRWTRGDADRGAVVVGSLTKLLACPGLRAGYVLAPDERVAARIRDRRPAWSVNGLAAEALPELLAAVDLPVWSQEIARLRDGLGDVLGRHGLRSLPSDAGYVLVEAPGLRTRLAPAGVLVRDCASFGLPRHARIAVPDEEGLERLDHALRVTARG